MTGSPKTLLPLVTMGLAAAAIWCLPTGPGSIARDTAPAPAVDSPTADLNALAIVTSERPLFDSSRRALATPETTAAPPAENARLTLAGILTDASQPIALLRLSTDGRLRPAIKGDEISNWRVVQIDSASVIIQGQSGDQSILRLGK